MNEEKDHGAALLPVDALASPSSTEALPTMTPGVSGCLLCESGWSLMTRFDADGEWHSTPNGMFRCVKGTPAPLIPEVDHL